MTKKVIFPEKIPKAGLYSPVVEANGFVFISGQLPIDPLTGKIIDDIRDAVRQVLVNMGTLLNAAGLSLSDVVKTTIFLKNMADFPVFNEIYADFFANQPPARSAVIVSDLPRGALLEIEAIAVRK